MLTPATVTLTRDVSGEIRLAAMSPRRPVRDRSPLQKGLLPAAQPPLSSNARISENIRCIRSGRGSIPRAVRYTPYAKRQLKNGCAVLKNMFGRKVLFLTITLAGSTDDAYSTFARYSASFVDTFRHWLREQSPDSQWVYKWEWQGRGALHLHAALGSADIQSLRRIRDGLARYIHSLYEHYSDRAGADLFARDSGGSWRGDIEVLRVEAKFVRKDIRRYMAKYISKSPGSALGYYPSRWYGMSNVVRIAVKAGRRTLRVCRRSQIEALATLRRALPCLARYEPVVCTYGNPVFHDDTTYIFWLDDRLSILAFENTSLLIENDSEVEPEFEPLPLVPHWWHVA